MARSERAAFIELQLRHIPTLRVHGGFTALPGLACKFTALNFIVSTAVRKGGGRGQRLGDRASGEPRAALGILTWPPRYTLRRRGLSRLFCALPRTRAFATREASQFNQPFRMGNFRRSETRGSE